MSRQTQTRLQPFWFSIILCRIITAYIDILDYIVYCQRWIFAIQMINANKLNQSKSMVYQNPKVALEDP